MDEVIGIFCPICKHKNEPAASNCTFCGAILGDLSASEPSTTRQMGIETSKFETASITSKLLPIVFKGLAIFTLDQTNPFAIRNEDEIILGRTPADCEPEECVIDLSALGGYEMGVSRNHAMLTKKRRSYELTDLGSTNGTWLNEQRLIANQPYPLMSGAQVRLGHLTLLIIFEVDD